MELLSFCIHSWSMFPFLVCFLFLLFGIVGTCQFGIICCGLCFPVLVCCTKKNLATLSRLIVGRSGLLEQPEPDIPALIILTHRYE
jgi:hypothetical protein